MIEVDDRQVMALLDDLTGREVQRVERQVLRQSGSMLIKQTRANLRASVRNTNKRSRFGKSMQSGVKQRIIKNDGDFESKVHIMGDFRLKFFELGTQERHTKSAKAISNGDRTRYRTGKGRRTGRIKPIYFFKRAKNTMEPIIYNNINKRVSQSIYNIYNKRK